MGSLKVRAVGSLALAHADNQLVDTKAENMLGVAPSPCYSSRHVSGLLFEAGLVKWAQANMVTPFSTGEPGVQDAAAGPAGTSSAHDYAMV